MKAFKILKLMDHGRGFFEKRHVNYPALRAILQTKLLMDQRRVPTIMSGSGRKKHGQRERNHFLSSLWFYALIGLVLVPFMIMGGNYTFQMSLAYAIIMFIIMTSMVSDFSSVLMDIRDRNILASKPVDTRTINMAKTLHILIYMTLLTGATTGIPLVVGLLRHGVIFFLIALIEVLLSDILIIFLTALLYFCILRYFDGEKLKDVINYVQIGLIIAIMIGYQFVVRSFDLVSLNVTFHLKWWDVFIPPIWFSAPFELVLHDRVNGYLILFSFMTLLVPLLALAFYMKLMPTFERNLQKLVNRGGKQKSQRRFSLESHKVLCRSKIEQAVFQFSCLMMKKEREFKLKVYPSLGFSIVLPFIFIFNALHDGSLADLSTSKWYLSFYFSLVIIPSVVVMLKYSGNYKGAWIYKALPIEEHGDIYKGAIKAFVYKLFVPLFLILAVVFIVLFGFRIVPDLIITFLNALLYVYICFLMTGKVIPFSRPFENIQQSDGIKIFFLIFIILGFVGLHWLCTIFSFVLYGYLLVLLAVNVIVWRKGFLLAARSFKG
ncbi:hypothetical protein GCM10011391_24480 [Pullulanibacillus camelliae]|uniref:Uncharacterized protein n=1 Tax=Pullulanibacillus camelliae TaxID=1707096 RepID=A0A8J2YIG5_9BACL|nr:hypothetical protein [Pullulanibacillus camelliae]GGE44773.1 hypothetical protein GCM10011391_24480 [Pullulanibacillus camelliae]